MFESLFHLLSDSPQAYFILFGVAFGDAIFPVLPSESAVILAGLLCVVGDLTLGWVIAVAAADAVPAANLPALRAPRGRGVGRVRGSPRLPRRPHLPRQAVARPPDRARNRIRDRVPVGGLAEDQRTSLTSSTTPRTIPTSAKIVIAAAVIPAAAMRTGAFDVFSPVNARSSSRSTCASIRSASVSPAVFGRSALSGGNCVGPPSIETW